MAHHKYHNWIRYGQNGMIVEITVRDESGNKIEGFRVNVNDKKAIRKVVRILKEKFGLDLSQKLDNKNKDLEWLN